jgi:pentalenic acid synthase
MNAYPQARTCPYHPSPAYAPLREGPPVKQVTLFDGKTAWLVTGHAEARQLLASPKVSSDRRRPGFPITSERGRAVNPNPPFVLLDPPEHTRHRRMLISEFTVRRFKELRPEIEATVHRALDAMLEAGPPADLAASFALPIPSMVICQMLGVPYEDHDLFQELSRRLVQTQDPDEVGMANLELLEYLTGLAADPPPGLIARLAEERVATGELSPQELAATALILLVAGHETTASMLTLGVITLLEHPEQLAKFRADPTLTSGTVEELLRYLSIVDGAPTRLALEDIELGGVTIKAGDGVLIGSSLANRDPEAFPEPDRFDITRQARHHVSFGYGVHQCLGQNLARMELELALPALFDRIPDIRLAKPVEELELRPPTTIQGVNSLPVEW